MAAWLLLAWANLQLPIFAPAQEVLRADPEPAYRAGPWRALGPFALAGAPSAAFELAPERSLRDMRAGLPWPELDARYEGAGHVPIFWQDADLDAAAAAADAGLIHPRERAGLETGVIEPQRLLPLAAADESGSTIAAFFYRTVHARNAVSVPVQLRAEGGLRLWCNGALVAELQPGAPPMPAEVALAPGLNHLLVKTATAGDPWSFELRQTHPLTQARIDRAINDGVRYLMERQLPDGSWQEYAEYDPGTTALATYTLIKSGAPVDHASVQRGLAYLRAHPARQTYSLALTLMAVGAAGDPADDEWIVDMADELVSWQESSGMWGYPTGGDLSNTQYAALGLWAAAKRGYEAPQQTWRKLAAAVLDCREGTGRGGRGGAGGGARGAGFGYVIGAGGATPSMTAAGVGTLAICLDHLGGDAVATTRRVREAIAAGAEWLGAHCLLHPLAGDATAWTTYALYGLERAGALAHLERFGEHPWYPEGAEWFVDRQHVNGAWAPSETNVNTCFALLFLARATAKSAVTQREGGASDGRLLATSAADGPLLLRAALGEPVHLWIDATTPDFVHIARVVYWVRPPGGAWQRVDGGLTKRFDAQYSCDAPGRWVLRASAFCHDGSSFGSGTLEFGRDTGVDSARADLDSRAAEANLLPTGSPGARASSGEAAFACDGRYDSRWMCRADDVAPWIEVALERRVKARRIALCAAPWEPADPERRITPARVSLRVNGGAPRVVEIPEGLPGRVIVDLGEETLLRSVRIDILSLRGGALGAAQAGFGEIEAYSGG